VKDVWTRSARFRHGFFRGSHGLVVAYDITNRSSFDNVDGFMKEKQDWAHWHCVVMLLGCKSDLAAQRVVSEAEGRYARARRVLVASTPDSYSVKERRHKAKANGALFAECSAMTGGA
jgi:GTPase SAR1 family protein